MDFNDRLKSITHGYGSMDYELGEYRAGRSGEDGDPGQRRPGGRLRHASSTGTRPRAGAGSCARSWPRSSRRRCSRSPIQAAIGGKIIARDNVREMRKDVTAKCYGGDISRKRKLLDKQKEGKKKMKQIRQGLHPAPMPSSRS